MSRVAVVAAAVVVGWSVPGGTAYADPPPPPPPPPAPKTTIDGDGTYAVGTDIVPGVYQSAGPVDGGVCYWKRSNGTDIVDNAMTKKAQIVSIEPSDTSFTTNECQQWQITDEAPPPPGNPVDFLGQLGSLLGRGALSGPPSGGN